MTSARVIRRREQRLSPWVTLVEKEVAFSPDAPGATYHAFKQADYVGVLAVTPSGLTPLIRQFRPAIERYTWELPGGLLEPGEDPAECGRRELREEVGLTVRRLQPLGASPAEVGRLENRHHMFFAETEEPDPAFVPEAGTTVELVSAAELDERIVKGTLDHPLHLALIFLHRLGLGRT